MRQTQRAICEGLVFIAGIMVIGAPSARAQMSMAGSGRSLGGYGAGTIDRYYSSGMTGYIPYNGSAGGFIAYRGGYAGGFGFEPISRRLPQTPIGGISMPLTAIGGASLAGGMQAGAKRELFTPFGYEGGIGRGADMIGTPMTRPAKKRSPSGLGFGYPFRSPGSLGSDAAGMSIMAP
jgi:hypothetical protein